MPSFTLREEKGRLSALVTQVLIAQAYDPKDGKDIPAVGEHMKLMALWDTGATGSVVTERVVQQCGLKPTGVQEVHTANGSVIRNTYMVNFVLPSNVIVPNINVTDGTLHGGIDALIGMDIITLGDFSISGKGKTVFSFRVPSQVETDFVQETKKAQHTPIHVTEPKIGRNDPCPCGSGKKYKQCHIGRPLPPASPPKQG